MSIDNLKKQLESELSKVDSIMLKTLKSDIDYINNVFSNISETKGKRIRGILVLLASKICNCCDSKQYILASIIEFIHTATLLHDDVIDNASLRRNIPTVNFLWDNKTAILSGDFIYSKAFELMLQLDDNSILRLLVQTTNAIVQAELEQLSNVNNYNLSLNSYINVIENKTASLIKTATLAAGMLAKAPSHQLTALSSYGLNLGVAFQITDDILDYWGENKNTGKAKGNDFKEGKITLPLIYTLNEATAKDKQFIINAIINKDKIDVNEVISILNKYEAKDYCQQVATEYMNKAIEAIDTFDSCVNKLALDKLAHLAVTRHN